MCPVLEHPADLAAPWAGYLFKPFELPRSRSQSGPDNSLCLEISGKKNNQARFYQKPKSDMAIGETPVLFRDR